MLGRMLESHCGDEEVGSALEPAEPSAIEREHPESSMTNFRAAEAVPGSPAEAEAEVEEHAVVRRGLFSVWMRLHGPPRGSRWSSRLIVARHRVGCRALSASS